MSVPDNVPSGKRPSRKCLRGKRLCTDLTRKFRSGIPFRAYYDDKNSWLLLNQNFVEHTWQNKTVFFYHHHHLHHHHHDFINHYKSFRNAFFKFRYNRHSQFLCTNIFLIFYKIGKKYFEAMTK